MGMGKVKGWRGARMAILWIYLLIDRLDDLATHHIQ